MNRFDLVTLAAVAIAIVLAGAASFALVAGSSPAAVPSPAPDPWATGGAAPTAAGSSGNALIIDVEGGVTHPGIWELPSGSRVADALAAAGGYADSADLAAAAQSLNLAASLVDGQQIYVPVTRGGAARWRRRSGRWARQPQPGHPVGAGGAPRHRSGHGRQDHRRAHRAALRDPR